MSTKVRIQNYLKRNRVSELFEEMMTKLVQDLPSEPVEYLVHLLQKRLTISGKKPSMKDTFVRQSLSRPTSSAASLWSDKKGHQLAKSSKLSSSANVAEVDGQDESTRHYSKPWLSNSKKEKSPIRERHRKDLSQSLPAQSKAEWDNRTKTPASAMDGVIRTEEENREEVDLRLVYAKPKVYGKPAEFDVDQEESEFQVDKKSTPSEASSAYTKPLSAAEAKRKRRQRLRETVKDEGKNNTSANRLIPDIDDDALELYEDTNELRSEGVKNPPKTGVYTSGNVNHRKEEIEMVLNMSKFFDSLGGAVSVSNYSEKQKSIGMHDNDDFESASQVTGPRHPVWEAPESEVESAVSRNRPSRLVNAALFDVASTTSSKKAKEPKAPTTPIKDGSAGPKVASSTKRRSGSQISGMSNRSAASRKSLTETNGRVRSPAHSLRDSYRGRVTPDASERPKTAQ